MLQRVHQTLEPHYYTLSILSLGVTGTLVVVGLINIVKAIFS